MRKWFILLAVVSFLGGSVTLAGGAYRGAITSGETRSYELLGPSYLDTFDFQGKKNELVLLNVSQTTSYFHPIISLYQDTTLLTKTPYSAYQNQLKYLLPGDGKYSLVVEDDDHTNGAKYNISFLELPTGPLKSSADSNGGAITSGETHLGKIDVSDMDAYQFTGNAGDKIICTVGQTSSYFHPMLYLFDAAGTKEAATKYSAYQNRLEHTLAKSGTYTLVLEDDNRLNAATYNLSFIELPTGPFTSTADPQGGAMTSGETRSGKIDVADMDAYQFTGKAGDKVIFSVGQTSSYFHPMLSLYAADGAKEAATSYSAYQNRLEHTLAKDGIYTLVLEDDDHMNVASYNLSFVALPSGPFTSLADPQGGAMTSGETRSGKIDVADMDAYQFTGKAGDKVIFSVGQTSVYFHPMLSLYAGDGTKEAGTTYSAYQNRLEHILAKDGKYTLILEDDDRLNAASYNLSFVELPTGPFTSLADPQGGAMTSGETRSGKIDVGDLDAYQFTGTAGDKVIIKVAQSTSYFHPMLSLYAVDGTKEAATKYSPYQNRLEHTLAKSGRYTIVLEDDDHQSSAAYSLSLLNLPRGPLTSTADPDGGAMISGESKAGTMGVGDLDAYQFYGKAGDRFVVNIAQTTSYIQPLLYLYTEKGVLEKKTSYAPYSNKLDTVLAATGLYTVVAEDDDGLNSASYNISLASIPHVVYATVCNFRYYYNNGKGDYYDGVVYGGPKSGYYAGYTLRTPTLSGLDENNQPGFYKILNYTLTADLSKSGQVFVNSYYDAETAKLYAPLNKGTAVGSAFLGSEVDYLSPVADGSVRFGKYDNIFWEADIGDMPEYNKYSFKYTYGTTLEYYTGVVYAGADKNYYAGKKWNWPKADENGAVGVYEITKAEYDPAITTAMLGQVLVNSYYDAESKTPYTPVSWVGSNYLGSEGGYIIKAGVKDFRFGLGYYEADVGNRYTFRYTYENKDYYEGWVYAAPTYGYFVGRKILKKNETGKTGYYEITGMSYNSVYSSMDKQVFVANYFDGDMSGKPYTPTLGPAPAGTAYLGSEAGYIVKAGNPDFYFGKGYYEADVGDRFAFIYSYGNEDFYTGYVYADPSRYYLGWESAKVNELNETGWYEIIGKTYTGKSAEYGKVYVNGYFNGDQDGKMYTPVSATTAKGSSHLGSEVGYILRSNVVAYKFGQGNWEADVGDRYSFIYTYGNGDFYTGIVYADPAYGYYPGWKKATGYNEVQEQGWYRITGMSYQGVSASLYGKVIVKSYSDGSATDTYYAPLNASTYFGLNYLGSEYGYIIELNNAAYKFGGGYEETDGS